MDSEKIVPWQSTQKAIIIDDKSVDSIVGASSIQLSVKDRSQIINGLSEGSYEMVSSFVWTKALSALKSQLSKIGTGFIAEMLDRPDIHEGANLQQVLTDFDAIRLAEELGAINGTGAFRLKQSMDLVFHFGSMEVEESDKVQMHKEEAILVIRNCIENILGQEKISFALNFKEFRDTLESQVLSKDDEQIEKILASPYFFKRALVRILLALIKSAQGAQLDNVLTNSSSILPRLWGKIKKPEKFQIGRGYAELTADGHTKAAGTIKQVLLSTQGFDFVPETIRSNSFINAANEVIQAHEGMNNFYNEPTPMRNLAKMGSTIPDAALPVCLSAALSVRLGNTFGISWGAQTYANSIIENISSAQWEYYFNESFAYDERILSKLYFEGSSPLKRWLEFVIDNEAITDILDKIEDKDVRDLLDESKKSHSKVATYKASVLLKKAGFFNV